MQILVTNKVYIHEHADVLSVVVNKDGDTPLSLECSHGNLDWVEALINKHIDPRSKH